MKKMNLPNKLTVFRICLVPVILLFGMLTPQSDGSLWFYISSGICAVIFVIAAITDMLDGKIARRDNLVTDFGKFLDPIADKFMVIGAMFVALYKFENLRTVMMLALLIVVFRELAVTSMRLVVSTEKNIVIAANMLGKVKTVLQVVAISTVFLEPVVQHLIIKIVEKASGQPSAWDTNIVPLSWLMLCASLVVTIWSGVNYIAAYWKYLDIEK